MPGPDALRHVALSFGKLATFHDGLGEYSLQLGTALAARADELRTDDGIVLHYHLRPALHGAFGDAVRYLPATGLQRFWHAPRQRFDLWHSVQQFNAYRAPAGARVRVQTVHDLNFYYLKHGAKVDKYRRRLLRLVRASDQVVAISRHVRADLVDRLGCPTPVEVICNGVRDLTAAPREAVAGLEGEGFFFHLSRLAPSKNVAALVELAAHWRDARFVFAGGASVYADAVREQVAARGLGNVRLLLDVTDAQKAWLYAHCAAFLFPSLAEGFGLPPLEAMHFGKPVFLSRLTSLPEVGGEWAHYFDSFDPTAMRRIIETALAADPDGARAPSIAAHARTFGWPRCRDAHVALYRRLLKMPKGTS